MQFVNPSAAAEMRAIQEDQALLTKENAAEEKIC